ncbi:hypothetical protein ACQ4PT_042447 [Festuca glaucescens]
MRPIPTDHDELPQLVSELIDANTRSWDMEKVNQFLLPWDASVVRNILLPARWQDDRWAWYYDKKGLFSVRTAYRMLATTKDHRTAWLEESTGSSNVKEVEKEWSALWQVKVPSKLRVFLWRLAKQSLPMADVLHRRHMAAQPSCALCGSPDSWRHSLLECNMARSVWALLPEEIVELVIQSQEPDARSWLASVFSSATHDELTQVVVTLWAIWHARRKALHEDVFQSPLSTHSFIRRFIDELNVLVAPVKQKVSGVSQVPRWIPPPPGVSKINIDAALSKNLNIASVLAIARDDTGLFLGASTQVLQGL